VASRPYEELVVRLAVMNLWGLTLVSTSVMHRQKKEEISGAGDE
jgi:hypothetical protein